MYFPIISVLQLHPPPPAAAPARLRRHGRRIDRAECPPDSDRPDGGNCAAAAHSSCGTSGADQEAPHKPDCVARSGKLSGIRPSGPLRWRAGLCARFWLIGFGSVSFGNGWRMGLLTCDQQTDDNSSAMLHVCSLCV